MWKQGYKLNLKKHSIRDSIKGPICEAEIIQLSILVASISIRDKLLYSQTINLTML